MGNKQGKPRQGTTATTGPASLAKGRAPAQATAAPAAPTTATTAVPPPPAPVQPTRKSNHPTLETKLSHVEVTTIFSPQEINAIRKHLAALLNQHESDPIAIPRDEFYRVLGTTTTSLYVHRLYAIFDMAGKGVIDFNDLVRGLSVLSQKASREQKLLLSFHLLDADGNGCITKHTTTELLRSCLAECKELEISLSDEQIARIVENTFEEADLDHNNVIDLNEYQALDAKHPGLFDFLTVDALGVLTHLEKVHSMTITPSSD